MKRIAIIFAAIAMLSCKRQMDVKYELRCVECAAEYTNEDGEKRAQVVRGAMDIYMEVDRGTDLRLRAVSGVEDGYIVMRIMNVSRELARAENYDPFAEETITATVK